jgi:hypothetical protein
MMRNIFFCFLVFFCTSIYCQTNGISYQAVILDPSGNAPLVNQTICLQFKITNSSSLIDYQETITTSTDDFGMINTIIGSGIPTGGLAATFNGIVWDETPKRLIVEIDLNATCSSFIEISNQPFTSVPYALYAKNGGSTNLSYTASATDGIVVSNTGDDAIIPLASETKSGLISPSEFSQLSNLTSSFAQKQDVLVDTVNIKTINGNSILGNGDLVVDGKVSQTITSEVTTSAPSEDAVFQALDLKINKNTFQTTAEHTPVNLFKITPFTPGNETFGIDFNSYPNSGPGAGTFNHGTWIGYNTGWHSEAPRTPGKPSIMVGLEDNYYDNDYDNDFGTEFYVQGFSPNGTSVRMSRPFYARGFQKDDGTDSWLTFLNVGKSGPNRIFRVSAGTDPLMGLTPTYSYFYKDVEIANYANNTTRSLILGGNRSDLGSLGDINWVNKQWNSNAKASISGETDTSVNNASLHFRTSPGDEPLVARMIIKANGNILTGTTTDNGVDKLQINGTVSGSPATLSNQFVIKSQLDTKQDILTNPVIGTGTANTVAKFTGSSTTGNSIITDNGALVDISAGGGPTIDTRLSVSGIGNGGAGRGTAILMNVPGSANSVNGVKINAYTTGGTTVDQSVDLAFDLASSGMLEERMRVKSNGNILIGTATDNAVDKLQINGTASGSPATLSNQFVIKDQLDTKQNILTNPLTGTGTVNTIPKFTGSSTTANSIITDNGALVDISAGGGPTIDTRFSVSGFGNGAAGRGTAILMNVPGSANSVNGVKINAYTTGGTTVDQSVDLAFDLASSGSLEEKMRIKANGNFLIGTTTDDTINKLQVAGTVVASQYKLSGLNVAPASATAPGTVGEIRFDADYMYVCVATNTWKRSPLATW